jgi:cellulose synthase/poly-beta-1,6-N-acetylglucosamine synthase-like glycosyltransferase
VADGLTIHIVRHILPHQFKTNADVERMVLQAETDEVEPFRRLAQLCGAPEQTLYERAAQAVGLAFSPFVPSAIPLRRDDTNVSRLAGVRSVRGRVLDREVLFVAPGLSGLARLARRVKAEPELGRQLCIVPPKALRRRLAAHHAGALRANALQKLASKWPLASAHLELGRPVRWGFVIGLAGLVGLAVAAPSVLLPILAPVLAVIYLVPAFLRLLAALYGLKLAPREKITPLLEADLPTYSVFIPLRDEAELIPQLTAAMAALDYPADRLQIGFVVEDTSHATIAALAPHLGKTQFELFVVPDGMPRTKPKAINYCLPFASGDLFVIFDAEDVPEPDQLKLAAAKFAQNPQIDCLQAELVIDNAPENALTALFTAEYAAQFGLILPTLARHDLPMPLGGTSNHFRTRTLHEIGGWDSFNVTEDADLGVRLARAGRKCGTLGSITYEEAPVALPGWIRQRTRWTKGWIQTFIVHNRHPMALLKDLGLFRFLIFEFYVGGLISSGPAHLAFLVMTALYLAGVVWAPPLFAGAWGGLFITVFILGYASSLATSFLGLARFGRLRLGWAQLLLPFYWALNSVAALRALVQLVAQPFVWEKTRHAQTRVVRRHFGKAPSIPKPDPAGATASL